MSRPFLPESERRVRISPLVAPVTAATMKAWAHNRDLSYGELIDQLFDHANKTHFNPSKKS